MSTDVRVSLLKIFDADLSRWWTSKSLAEELGLSASAVRENLRVLRIRGALVRRKFGNRYEHRRRAS